MNHLDGDSAPGPLVWLQSWYALQCDGEWEHGYGITIETMDNPGWSLKVELQGTPLQSRVFERVTVERDEHDWLTAWTQDSTFYVTCGTLNLSEAIHTFRLWADQRLPRGSAVIPRRRRRWWP